MGTEPLHTDRKYFGPRQGRKPPAAGVGQSLEILKVTLIQGNDLLR